MKWLVLLIALLVGCARGYEPPPADSLSVELGPWHMHVYSQGIYAYTNTGLVLPASDRRHEGSYWGAGYDRHGGDIHIFDVHGNVYAEIPCEGRKLSVYYEHKDGVYATVDSTIIRRVFWF
jgi:hypothetical protein